MFENPGEKLKKLSITLFVINIIAFLIAAILVGKAGYHFSFWRFLGVLVGGFIVSYIEALFLYAFGELVDSSELTQRNTYQQLARLHDIELKLQELQAPAPAAAAPAAKAPASPAPKAAASADAPTPAPSRFEAAPAQPQSPPPPVEPKDKTLADHLQYALRFHSDESMQKYLISVVSAPDSSLSPAEQVTLRTLCSLPVQDLRSAVKNTLQQLGVSQP